MEPKFFLCECSSKEHQLSLEQEDYEDNFPMLFLNTHLSNVLPWYKRLINAVRYVFGYRCKYGDFDEFIFDMNTAKDFRDILDTYIDKKELHFEEQEVEVQ